LASRDCNAFPESHKDWGLAFLLPLGQASQVLRRLRHLRNKDSGPEAA
jgi:hypothetical protein